MGVITTADTQRDEAKQHLKDAYKCLKVVLEEDTWGHTDLKKEYIEELEMISLQILKLSKKI